MRCDCRDHFVALVEREEGKTVHVWILTRLLTEFETSIYGASLVVQMEKSPPAMQETWVRSLSREDPLDEEMATRSSILSWRIPRTAEPGGGCSLQGLKESDTTEHIHTRTHTHGAWHKEPLSGW